MINTKKENPVADHFNDENHLNNKFDYKINIVGQEANKNRRLRLEEAWMLLLNTHYPNGLYSQVVAATKRRNMKYIHLELVTKQPMKKPTFIPLTIVPISEMKQPKKQPNNDFKILKKNTKH